MSVPKINFIWSLLFLIPVMGAGQIRDSRPNIIYIMVDDMGYADLEGYGRKDYKTPNLDRLASEGMKFTNAYAGAPVCTPTRVSYMTGRYPARHPVGLREPLEWSTRDSALGLNGDQPTLASVLKENGYHTALIGKWHLGFRPEFHPMKNGFNEFFGFMGGGVDFVAHTSPDGQHDLYENENPIEKKGYLTNILTDRVIEFLDREHKSPFFLSLQFNAPHWPWQGPDDAAYHDTMSFRAGGSQIIFASMVENLDKNIGRILTELERKDFAGNTMVIFVSDNGGERYSDMGQLKGAKMSLWEGGIRVPAFIRWPGKIKPGFTTDQPIITMDWTATMMAAAGVKNIRKYNLDGISLLPFFEKPSKKMDRSFYWRLSRVPQKAMRDGQWKYVSDEKGEYLFNLVNDISEKNDLSQIEKARFEKLKKKYEAWEATVLPPFLYTRN
jgi:arylsulfatase A-like enzyme